MIEQYAKEKGFELTGNNGFDSLLRPNIDLYYMNLCFGVNLRSLDKSSKCGCIACSEDGAFLTSGYNSPLRGSDDKNIPHTRPEKYDYMEHSERNAIYNAARHGTQIIGSTFYITGFPCIPCLRGMCQSGAKKIVYGPMQAAMLKDDIFDRYADILKGQEVIINRFKYDKGLYFLNPMAKFIVDLKTKQGIKDINFEYEYCAFYSLE